MMFKKIICAATACLLAVSLAACSSTSSAEAHKLITQAVDTVNSAAGLDMTINTSLNVVASGQNSSMAYNATHKTQTADGKTQSDTVIMVSADDQSQQTEYIIDGDQGYVVVNDDDSSMEKITTAELTPYMTFTKLYANFEKSAVRKVKTDKKEGRTTYDITLKEKKAADFARDYIAAFMMAEASTINASVSKAKVSLTTDENGQPTAVRVTLNAEAWQGDNMDSKITCILYSSYLINELGEGVSVTLPDTSGATEHTESSESE